MGVCEEIFDWRCKRIISFKYSSQIVNTTILYLVPKKNGLLGANGCDQ